MGDRLNYLKDAVTNVTSEELQELRQLLGTDPAAEWGDGDRFWCFGIRGDRPVYLS